MKLRSYALAFAVTSASVLLNPAYADTEFHEPILPELSTSAHTMTSTIPKSGDLNPYGVAFVPREFREGGPLEPGDILVSNFNSSSNQQGTGTTIVRIHENSQTSTFFKGTPPLGLTTALGVLSGGFVLVGNLPTDSSGAVQGPGSLLILNRFGIQVAALTSATLLDGPWDLTIHDEGDRAQVFVSNVLSGTVTRLDLVMDDDKPNAVTAVRMTQIASRYLTRSDPNALVVGPTGLAYDAGRDILYVSSTGDNEIFAIANARTTASDSGKGTLVYHDVTHLHGPLGLVLAPNGDLIAANGDAVNGDPNAPNGLVEFTRAGMFVAEFRLDAGGAGGAFGIAISGDGDRVRFAAVDDNQNNVNIWLVR